MNYGKTRDWQNVTERCSVGCERCMNDLEWMNSKKEGLCAPCYIEKVVIPNSEPIESVSDELIGRELVRVKRGVPGATVGYKYKIFDIAGDYITFYDDNRFLSMALAPGYFRLLPEQPKLSKQENKEHRMNYGKIEDWKKQDDTGDHSCKHCDQPSRWFESKLKIALCLDCYIDRVVIPNTEFIEEVDYDLIGREIVCTDDFGFEEIETGVSYKITGCNGLRTCRLNRKSSWGGDFIRGAFRIIPESTLA